MELTDEEKQAKKDQAQAVLDKINAQEDPAAADMDALAKEVDENLTASTKTFGSDDTALDDKLKEAVKSLTDGQVAPEVIEGEDAYYVARMDATFDEDATQSKKESIVTERKQEAYNDLLKEWGKDTKIDVDKKVWKKVTLTDSDSYTFKQPETTDTGDTGAADTGDTNTGDTGATDTGDTNTGDTGATDAATPTQAIPEPLTPATPIQAIPEPLTLTTPTQQTPSNTIFKYRVITIHRITKTAGSSQSTEPLLVFYSSRIQSQVKEARGRGRESIRQARLSRSEPRAGLECFPAPGPAPLLPSLCPPISTAISINLLPPSVKKTHSYAIPHNAPSQTPHPQSPSYKPFPPIFPSPPASPAALPHQSLSAPL